MQPVLARLSGVFTKVLHDSNKGEAGTGNVVAAVTHARLIDQEIRQVQTLDDSGLDDAANLIMDRYRVLAESVSTGDIKPNSIWRNR